MTDFYIIVEDINNYDNSILINIKNVYIKCNSNSDNYQVFNINTDKFIGYIKKSTYEQIISIIKGTERYEEGTVVY